MGEPSIFEKIRARNRMIEAVGTEPAPPPVAPPKAKGTKRVPYRDPETQKILWKDVPED
jgi:hypothetical protein